MAICPVDDGTDCVCPLTDLMDTLGNRYAMQLVCALGTHDGLRFSELEGHLPDASTSTITDRLGELERAGLVDRESFDEYPPRVEYHLTDAGAELSDHLRPLLEWVEDQG